MQTRYDADGRAEVRAADETGRHDADHAGVGKRVLNRNAAVGAEDGDAGKITVKMMRSNRESLLIMSRSKSLSREMTSPRMTA